MKILRRVVRWIDILTIWQRNILAPLCVTLILITLWDIIGRQLGLYTAWAFDVEWYHFAFLLMLAMGYTTLKGAQVRVDLITTRYPRRLQEILMTINYLFFVIPFMVVVAIYAWTFAMHSREMNEMTLTAWVCPLWPIKLSIFIGIVSMLPQSFAQLIRHGYFVIKQVEL